MPGHSPEQLFYLALVWAAWCGLHSLLLADLLRPRLERALRLTTTQYRLAYSALSLITICPVFAYSRALGAFTPPALAPALAGAPGRRLGAAFHRRGQEHHLVTSGAYARMRHPMHLAAILVVWLRPHSGMADLVISILLSAYIVLGTWHEESRLRRQFGDEYRAYASRVGLIPFLK